MHAYQMCFSLQTGNGDSKITSGFCFLPLAFLAWCNETMVLLCNIVRGFKSYASGEISCDKQLK